MRCSKNWPAVAKYTPDRSHDAPGAMKSTVGSRRTTSPPTVTTIDLNVASRSTIA